MDRICEDCSELSVGMSWLLSCIYLNKSAKKKKLSFYLKKVKSFAAASV